MKIACVILGTRGDVQPMVALATGLMKNGHEVIICAPPENEELARRNNCRFMAFGPGIKKLVRDKPEKYNRIFEQVRDATNQRLIISKGWAVLPGENDHDILYVDETPFNLLFPKLAAVIYHGGTGTMAAIARAGIPQAAFPFMGDQFANQKQIVKLRLGPDTCSFKKMTAEAIISAITECITNENYRIKAQEIARKLKNTDGVDLTVKLIEKELNK